jgi:uncharacterized protein (TIRG00374 family)
LSTAEDSPPKEPSVAPPAAPPAPLDAPGSLPPPPEAAVAPEPPKPSRVLGTIVKFVVAAAIIGFLVYTKKIDPAKVGRAMTPVWIAESLALVFACIVIISVRWWLLLRLEKIDLSIVDTVKLTLVGHFWNNFLPGAVTGDGVKMYYIGRKYPALSAEAYATVVIDRLIGLAALVYLSFFFALGNLDFVSAHAELRLTFGGNCLAAAGFTVAIGALVLGVGRKSSFADKLRTSKLPGIHSFRRGYRSLIRLGENPSILLASFALGVCSHALLVVIAVTAGQALGENTLSPSTYFFLVPVGLFVNSIPIGLPGGLGVGEGAFGLLFQWAGDVSSTGASHGGDIMALLRLSQLAWGTVGAAIYVFDRKTLAPGPTPETPSANP